MILPFYQPTETELFICDLYQTLNIQHPHEMDIDLIAAVWGVDIAYYVGRPCSYWDKAGGLILLNKNVPLERSRADFFHELCHIAKHEGNQDDMPELFRDLQELQAAQFQLIAAMPCYLLPEPTEWIWNHYIGLLADTFRVPIDLAVRRAAQIECRFHIDYYRHRFAIHNPLEGGHDYAAVSLYPSEYGRTSR